MTHEYRIGGMSCEGCRTKVQNTLNELPGVSAMVTFDPPVATIEMDRHLPTEEMQKALSLPESTRSKCIL